jgi:hypothetical protein
MKLNNPYAIENFVTNGWRGYFPLFQAFWRYYLVGRLIAFVIALLLVANGGFIGWFIGIMIWVPYWIWSFVTMWQCAFNSDVPYLGYVVRILLYVEAVYILFNPTWLSIAF